ncbi:DUF448 domain-containing protein [Geoalkalibacter halelectricus]|uniref:DUF448 domain-containing protein n=1 Tax=Geoalkalibacter halelectricus TaxID=2847045 RepID=A0ABY5ZQK0_9BACT|nr:DUF448 domain-containing protein [Geoalkalibacter halelectricus]MDO3376685.1 DUF448 domain-containing protein [Geoalkalibacter halelectricus]UWZ81363.1 DUF448 domain-containing protein [Geoalkalibacter halelectricus]
MSGHHGAQRSCLGCRKVLDKSSLVRYVLAADGRVLVDFRQKLPGRGAYTCLSRGCQREAVRRNQFQRAFRGRNQAVAEGELAAELTRQLADKVDGLLGMVRKAGLAVGGSNLVLSSLDKKDELALVIVAQDISEGVLEKVRRKADAAAVPLFTWGHKEILGRCMGKEERSVIGVKKASLATALQEGLARYERFVGEI